MIAPGGQAVLRLEDYSFWFRPPTDSPEGPAALTGATFEIRQGSFVLILGRSGSGKSTLALNLVGIYPDYFGGRNAGRVLLDPGSGLQNRRDFGRGERFKLVNMLFQNPEDQIVTLTVEEEVAFALENYLFEPDEINRRIDWALDLVGLDGFRERSTMKLSGGEKQRVALAAMLALEPRVLLLDEPTSNLDPAGTADVLETVDRVRSRIDLTVVVIEHEVDEIFDRVDTVLLVENQRVEGPFTPREFMQKHGLHVRDEMGLWIPQACEVGLELVRAGISLSDVPLNGQELATMVRASVPGFAPGGERKLATMPPTSTRRRTTSEAALNDIAIEIRDVSFAYEDGPKVLDGIDLDVRRGELLAIVGQNGSGKSTLASLLNGIATPTAGQVLVDGRPTTDFNFHELVRRVAFIFQVPEKQFVGRTVESEMSHGLRGLGLPEEEVTRRVDEYLELIRLADRRQASPYVLSHGQKRRLSVASMVITEPDVVILDEPTFGQDYQQAQNLMQLLKRLADDGAAVMFITHDMRLVAEYADRAAVLCRGKKLFEGHPLELFAASDVLSAARLKAPNVYSISTDLLGHPLLTTQELVTAVKEAAHAER